MSSVCVVNAPPHEPALFPDRAVLMSDNTSDRHFLWLWTWVFVAVTSAGYAVVNLISSTPGEAEGASGLFRFLLDVALPIGMCAFAAWLGVEEWRSSTDAA